MLEIVCASEEKQSRFQRTTGLHAAEHRKESRLPEVVYNGYLNGPLSVAWALGQWHMEGMKMMGDDSGSGPSIAKPELMTANLTEDDEFP